MGEGEKEREEDRREGAEVSSEGEYVLSASKVEVLTQSPGGRTPRKGPRREECKTRNDSVAWLTRGQVLGEEDEENSRDVHLTGFGPGVTVYGWL